MAGRKGGKRPGAGRKPKAEKQITAINLAEGRIADRLPELIDWMFKLARDGDRAACEYLINRVMGKPTERLEHKGEEGRLFKVYMNIDIDRV